jgi:hypothetical protein
VVRRRGEDHVLHAPPPPGDDHQADGQVLQRRHQAGEEAEHEVEAQRGEEDEDEVEERRGQEQSRHRIGVGEGHVVEDDAARQADLDQRVQVPAHHRRLAPGGDELLHVPERHQLVGGEGTEQEADAQSVHLPAQGPIDELRVAGRDGEEEDQRQAGDGRQDLHPQPLADQDLARQPALEGLAAGARARRRGEGQHRQGAGPPFDQARRLGARRVVRGLRAARHLPLLRHRRGRVVGALRADRCHGRAGLRLRGRLLAGAGIALGWDHDR